MVRRALFWSFGAQAVSFSMMFAGSVILARLLTPREMGIYAVALATSGILQVVAAFGVGNYVVRAVALEPHTLTTAFTVNAALGALLAAALLVASGYVGSFLDEPAVAQVLRVLAIAPVISILDLRPSSMLQREMRFGAISIVTTLQAVCSTAVTVGAAYAGASYMSPAFGVLATALAGAAGYSLLGRRHVGIGLSVRDWRAIAAFGLRMMSIGGIAVLAVRLSDVILARLLGLPALGLYTRAQSLANLLFQNIYGAATRVIFAQLSKAHRERGQLHDVFLRGLRIIAAIMGPSFIGLAILARPAVLLLYGERWLGAADILSLLMIANFISLRFAMNWELFVIRGELKVQTRLEIARSVFGVLSRSVGSSIGLLAAAAASVVDALFSAAIYGRRIDRLIDAEERDLSRVSLEAVLVTCAAVAPAFALMLWWRWDPRTPLPLVAGAVVAGAMLWLICLRWRDHPLFGEVRAILNFATVRLRAMRAGPD